MRDFARQSISCGLVALLSLRGGAQARLAVARVEREHSYKSNERWAKTARAVLNGSYALSDVLGDCCSQLRTKDGHEQ